MAARGLIVAAPSSGSGKTTLTLGLLRQFARTNVPVSSFKIGPDYIDPGYHTAAGGRHCLNLDLWAMRPETVASLFAQATSYAEIVVGEGVMGLFDGAAVPEGEYAGSTADAAARLGLPVLLVVDASSQAQSAAALVHGFATWRDDVRIAGVVFNRVGGERHASMLRGAMAGRGIPVLGCLPRAAELALPERHLGLVQASEMERLEAFLEHAANRVAAHIDVDALKAAMADIAPRRASALPPLRPLGQRIAVASDDAFRFVYRHVLDGWRAAGAEIVPFSPLADEAPAATADAVYLPGGYPELHVGRLAANTVFFDGLCAAAQRGASIYGECGGYMVLGETLTDADGRTHRMAGLLPLATSFAERKLHLGYRTATLADDHRFGAAGSAFGAHEFHYATTAGEGVALPLFHVSDAAGTDLGRAGMVRGTVSGSFVHLIDRR